MGKKRYSFKGTKYEKIVELSYPWDKWSFIIGLIVSIILLLLFFWVPLLLTLGGVMGISSLFFLLITPFNFIITNDLLNKKITIEKNGVFTFSRNYILDYDQNPIIYSGEHILKWYVPEIKYRKGGKTTALYLRPNWLVGSAFSPMSAKFLSKDEILEISNYLGLNFQCSKMDYMVRVLNVDNVVAYKLFSAGFEHPIDLNKVTIEKLIQIEGISPTKARIIIGAYNKYRNLE